MKKQKNMNPSYPHKQEPYAMTRIATATLLVAAPAMLLFANLPLFAAAQGQQPLNTNMTGNATSNSSSSNTITNMTTANTTAAGNQSSQATISNIKSLLSDLMSAYKIQNYTGAENAAVDAYLDNFESLEGPIATHDQQLMVQTELLLREQLRQAIQNKAPVEQVQQLVDQINANLDRAASLPIQK
jgi:dynactin complex subunit